MTHTELNLPEIKSLAKMAVSFCSGRHVELTKFARSKAFKQIPVPEIIETLLEIHLFVGFPAVLAVTGWSRQLNSHIRGCLNVGAKRTELSSISKAINPLISRI